MPGHLKHESNIIFKNWSVAPEKHAASPFWNQTVLTCRDTNAVYSQNIDIISAQNAYFLNAK